MSYRGLDVLLRSRCFYRKYLVPHRHLVIFVWAITKIMNSKQRMLILYSITHLIENLILHLLGSSGICLGFVCHNDKVLISVLICDLNNCCYVNTQLCRCNYSSTE